MEYNFDKLANTPVLILYASLQEYNMRSIKKNTVRQKSLCAIKFDAKNSDFSYEWKAQTGILTGIYVCFFGRQRALFIIVQIITPSYSNC